MTDDPSLIDAAIGRLSDADRDRFLREWAEWVKKVDLHQGMHRRGMKVAARWLRPLSEQTREEAARRTWFGDPTAAVWSAFADETERAEREVARGAR